MQPFRVAFRNRYVIPLGVTLLLAAGWVAALAIPGVFLWLLLLYAVSPRWAIAICSAAALTLIALCWWRDRIAGGVMLAGLLAALWFAFYPDLRASASLRVADWVQFQYYRRELRAASQSLARQHVFPPVAVQPIDGFMTAGYGLAYDPSGQIMLPASRRSDAWRRATRDTELVNSCLSAQHITGAYYRWFTC